MRLIKTGITRWVLLIGNYAIKFPSLYTYRNFLLGILANEQEAKWSTAFRWTKRLCPVIYRSPFYLFIVMPKVRVMTDQECKEIWGWNEREMARNKQTPLDGFLNIEPGEPGQFPVEKKSNSFGWLDGRIVIIDYGS